MSREKVSRKFFATFRIKMHGRGRKTALSSRGLVGDRKLSRALTCLRAALKGFFPFYAFFPFPETGIGLLRGFPFSRFHFPIHPLKGFFVKQTGSAYHLNGKPGNSGQKLNGTVHRGGNFLEKSNTFWGITFPLFFTGTTDIFCTICLDY